MVPVLVREQAYEYAHFYRRLLNEVRESEINFYE